MWEVIVTKDGMAGAFYFTSDEAKEEFCKDCGADHIECNYHPIY